MMKPRWLASAVGSAFLSSTAATRVSLAAITSSKYDCARSPSQKFIATMVIRAKNPMIRNAEVDCERNEWPTGFVIDGLRF